MKLIHLSDLHLGKRVNEFSMLEEQRAILAQILDVIDAEAPDAILIAGDVYDKSVPSAEAVQLFDGFLSALASRRLQVFVISGNHDSPERIAFGSRIMDAQGIHLSPVYNGEVQPFSLQDAHGTVNIYMLPFVKPSHVHRFFADEEIASYTDAMRVAIQAMRLNTAERNVLVAHQYVTGATTCDSEELPVGGLDNVDAEVFADFDYVALGHIHGAQDCGTSRIRYCGTPLKYSFSEASHQKSASIVTLGEKGVLEVRTVPLIPIHDMSEIRGTFAELTDPAYYSNAPFLSHYLRITLTDEEDVPNAVERLRRIYKNLMRIDYDNKRTRENAIITGAVDADRKSAFALFAEFFQMQNNSAMSDVQSDFMRALIEKIEEELA